MKKNVLTASFDRDALVVVITIESWLTSASRCADFETASIFNRKLIVTGKMQIGTRPLAILHAVDVNFVQSNANLRYF